VILLDTHAWLWLGSNPARLSRTAAAAISGAVRSGGIAVASVSLVEIAWLMAHNRLGLRGTSETVLTRLVEETGVVVKEITPTVSLPPPRAPRRCRWLHATLGFGGAGWSRQCGDTI